MDKIVFKVQGSALEPYEVVFIKRSAIKFSAFCSCPAGLRGQNCKHKVLILDGVTKGITSQNIQQVEIIQSWLPGTEVDDALKKVQVLENDMKNIKNLLSAAKKNLAKEMRD